MQARYHDPVVGRFLSVDPVTFMDTNDPHQLSRYLYTNNDPVNMIDPDGRDGIYLRAEILGAAGVGSEAGIGLYIANEGGPKLLGGFDVGFTGNVGAKLGLGISGEISVGAFEGNASDFASPTQDFDVNVPSSPVGLGASLDVGMSHAPNPNEGGFGILDNLSANASSEVQNLADNLSHNLETVSSIGLGLSVGGGATTGGSATGTFGLSGFNGDGWNPFSRDKDEE